MTSFFIEYTISNVCIHMSMRLDRYRDRLSLSSRVFLFFLLVAFFLFVPLDGNDNDDDDDDAQVYISILHANKSRGYKTEMIITMISMCIYVFFSTVDIRQ